MTNRDQSRGSDAMAEILACHSRSALENEVCERRECFPRLREEVRSLLGSYTRARVAKLCFYTKLDIRTLVDQQFVNGLEPLGLVLYSIPRGLNARSEIHYKSRVRFSDRSLALRVPLRDIDYWLRPR